jgi:hypothetical protein
MAGGCSTIISKGMRYRKLDIPSFEFVGERHWCRVCQQDTDSTTEHGRSQGVSVYRKVCKRCGRVTHYGVDMTQLRSPTPSIFSSIRQWIQRRGVHL